MPSSDKISLWGFLELCRECSSENSEVEGVHIKLLHLKESMVESWGMVIKILSPYLGKIMRCSKSYLRYLSQL